MFQRFLRSCRIAAIAAATLLCLPANAQPANAQQTAVRSQVLGRIDSRRASEGGSFFVKTLSAWKQAPCVIPSGALLEGHIAKVQRKGAGVKREEMDLRFLPIPCSGDEAQEIVPVLIAMQGAQPDPREAFMMQEQMARALSSALRRIPASSDSSGGSSRTPGTPGNMSGAVGSLGNFSPATANQRPLHPQEVLGIPGVKLSLPILTTDPTALSSSNQILIDPETQFLLVLELAPRPEPSDTPAAERATITRPVTEPIAPPVKPPVEEDVEIEQCVETGCAFADSPDALSVDNQLERTLSLRAFGYKVRGNRVLRALAEDAAVRFLGQDQLLITFNAHPLIVRSQDESSRLASPRIIRALLFSTKTGKIIRAEDWRIPGEGPYLWPLDGGRVLAHVGSILAVYGPGLKLEHQWAPGGEVRFLRVSPSRHLIVAAIAHERHTPEQHRRIAEFVGPEHPVDEDFDLTLLDGQLNVQDYPARSDLAHIVRSSGYRIDRDRARLT